MLKKFLLTLTTTVLIVLASNAQIIQGALKDSSEKKNIPNAVIALLRTGDSILYKFTRSDKEGKFNLNNIKPGNYILLITHPNYADYVDDITIPSSGLQLKTISFIPKSKLLQEVIIRNKGAIKIKGDTISFIADSFKVSENANVEELLKKMPGIQVDKNGQIKAMGEKVEKVLVDGEEFFGDDPGMAVKNLRADAVKEVQVFDKKSDQAEFTGIDDGKTKKTINLKLKEDKKTGHFGKIDLAGGLQNDIDNRYNTNILFNTFKGKRKIAGFLLKGNIGKDGLGFQDQQKYSGDDDNMSMMMNEDGGMMFNWRNGSDEDPYIDPNNGYFDNLNAGLHYSNKWNDKHTLNFSPKFNQQKYTNNTSTFSQYQLGNTVYNTNSVENDFNNKKNTKNSLVYDFKIDSLNSLRITTKLNMYNSTGKIYKQSANTNRDGQLNNSNSSSSDNTGDKTSLSNSILYKHKFKKDRRTLSINTDFNLFDTKNNQFQYSDIAYYDSGRFLRRDTIDQKKNSLTTNRKFTVKAVYTEPLGKKYAMEINDEFSGRKGTNDLTTLSGNRDTKTYTTPVDSLTNNFREKVNNNKVGIKFSYKFKKLKYSLGAAAGFTNYDLLDITQAKDYSRNYTNLFPAANLQYAYKPNHNITVNYSGSTIQPTLNQLQKILNNNDPLNVYIGNPTLKQSFRQDISLSHNSYNFLNEMWTYQSVNFSSTDNAITNSTQIDQSGKITTQPINTNGNYSINSWMGIGKKIKKWQVDLNGNISFNYSQFREMVNGSLNNSTNSSTMLSLTLNKSKEKKYDFSVENDVGFNSNKSSVYNNSSVKYNTYTIDCNAAVYIHKDWKISSDFEYNYRQKTNDFSNDVNNNLWNAQLLRNFHHDEFTAYFSIKDILNQNIGLDRSMYGNTLTEVKNERLKRYWMVGFTWNFKNKAPKSK